MMQIEWLEDMLSGFCERMNNIAVFSPIIELSQKTKYRYNLPTMGIAVMLYILENMLRGEKNCTYEAIAFFLQHIVQRQYNEQLSSEEAVEMANFIVREGLMNNGRPHAFTYPDLEKKTEKTHKFHLVELEEYDIKDRSVRLKLSTAGLEMLFKTKEMYNELQVSITQLYLRQQLQRINEQLAREKTVFNELQELIDYTMGEYHSGKFTEKEELAVEKIMKIRRKLMDVIHLHESLFTDKIRVQNLMNHSIESMILTAFNTRVNFETEFLFPVVQRNVSMELLKQLLDPVLPVRKPLSFNPGRLFEEQRLKGQDEEPGEQELPEMAEELQRQEEEKERELQAAKEMKIEQYLLLLLTPLIEQEEVTISAVLRSLKENDPIEYEALINHLDFYSFIVQLHQMGQIPMLAGWETETMILDDLPRVLVKIVAQHSDIYNLKAFELVAKDEIIHLPNGYVMSDFSVRRGNPDGVA